METVQAKIESIISRKKAGAILFLSDFNSLGTTSAIRQSLSRLVKKGKIIRVGQGIYCTPKEDELIGSIQPSADDIIKLLAKKEKIRIKPAGVYALHQLGLTTQVPMKRVYITDGHSRKFQIGKLTIRFKPTTSKRLLRKGKLSSLIIQAIEELGEEYIDKQTQDKLYNLLLQEKREILKHDLSLSPAKVHDYILKLFKERNNDWMAQ